MKHSIRIAGWCLSFVLLSQMSAFAQFWKKDKKEEKQELTEEQKLEQMADTLGNMELMKRASYAIGVNLATDLSNQGVDLDPDLVMLAIQDINQGDSLKLSQQQLQQTLQELQAMMKQKAQERADSMARAGKEWLEENKKKEAVQVTESGLQYEVIEKGEGEKPAATDKVRVHYRGSKLDGSVFDSSYERGQPAEFKLNQVIPGWTEGLQLMPMGSKYMLYIPPELGYGTQAPPSIGPNQVLVFEVELLDILEE